MGAVTIHLSGGGDRAVAEDAFQRLGRVRVALAELYEDAK